jgi:hypothetical protein
LNRWRGCRFSTSKGGCRYFWNRPNRYLKHLDVPKSRVIKVKSAKMTRKKKATKSNSQRYEVADLIVLHRLSNGFYSGSVDFRSRIKYLGWVGLEPTTNPDSQKAFGAARLDWVRGWTKSLVHCDREFRVLLELQLSL